MPAPLDLTGQRFGKLLVLNSTGRKRETLSKEALLWLCQCDCGRQEEIPQLYIPSTPSKALRRGAKWACSVCSRGRCEICNGEILTDQFLGVCSQVCHYERRRLNYRNHYYRLVEKNPNLNKERWEKKMLRLESDPDLKEQFLEKERLRDALRRQNDSEAMNAAARERYWKRRDEVIARRKALYDQNHELRLEWQREYWKEHGHKYLTRRAERINAMTDEEREAHYQAVNARAREFYRLRKQRLALEELAKVGNKLKDLNDE